MLRNIDERKNKEAITNSLSLCSRRGQTSRKYVSLYFGKRVAKEDSSIKPLGLSSGLNSSIFQ